jgi:hypothetical protein
MKRKCGRPRVTRNKKARINAVDAGFENRNNRIQTACFASGTQNRLNA